MDIKQVLKDKPVIAAIRNTEDFRTGDASHASVGVLFLIGGTIFDLPALVEQAERLKKLVFIDIDLIKGVGKTLPGLDIWPEKAVFTASSRRKVIS